MRWAAAAAVGTQRACQKGNDLSDTNRTDINLPSSTVFSLAIILFWRMSVRKRYIEATVTTSLSLEATRINILALGEQPIPTCSAQTPITIERFVTINSLLRNILSSIRIFNVLYQETKAFHFKFCM